jgi:hypothetical protein
MLPFNEHRRKKMTLTTVFRQGLSMQMGKTMPLKTTLLRRPLTGFV